MIRLGVIGHGHRISRMIKLRMRKVEPDVRIVGIVDPDPKNARAKLDDCDRNDVVFYESMKEMVAKAKLDAIAIGTRCNLHTPFAIEASKYDIPLYLEKPVATTMDQAIKLEHAFENSKCPTLVAFPMRVSPLCKLAKQYITEGKIGKPEHISAINNKNGVDYFDTWYRNFDITQGLFIQKATHDFDYMSYLMNAKIVRVAATWSRGRVFGGNKKEGLMCSECDEIKTCIESPINRQLYKTGPITVRYGESGDHPCLFSKDIGSPESGMNEDSSSTIIEFDNGTHGIYSQVFFSRHDAVVRGSRISGYKGTVNFDWYKDSLEFVNHQSILKDTCKIQPNSAHHGGDIELSRNFFDIINGKDKPHATIWDGIQSVYSCLAAKESAETGMFVNVRQVGSLS